MAGSVADSATTALRDLVARGRYQAGDRLPSERALAEGLELSRPTLREAIRRLTEAGILESRRGSGTYVADVDLDSVFAVRLQLEPYAARLAAEERTPAEVQHLVALGNDLRRLRDDPEAFASTDLEIHHMLARASRNSVLMGLLDRLTELTQLSRSLTSPSENARRGTLRDLGSVVRAVRDGDPERAASAMEAHISSVRAIAATLAPTDRQIRPARRAAAA